MNIKAWPLTVGNLRLIFLCIIHFAHTLKGLGETSREQVGRLLRGRGSRELPMLTFCPSRNVYPEKSSSQAKPGSEGEGGWWRQISAPQTSMGPSPTRHCHPHIKVGQEEFVPVNSIFPVTPLTSPGSRVSCPASGASTVDNKDADCIRWLQR